MLLPIISRLLLLVPLLLGSLIHSLPMPHSFVSAAVASCYGIVSPSSMGINSQKTISVSVENQDSGETIQQVRITAPTLVTLVSGSASGWSASISDNTVTFTGSTMVGEVSQVFSLVVTSGSSSGSENWHVVVQDDDGDDTTCGGNQSFTITDSTDLSISSLSVSSVSDTSAIVSFATNLSATSTINYGTTTSYGSTQSITGATTSHSYTITGLSSNTTYHYQVQATDGSTSDSSNDTTFVTALPGTTSTPGPTSTPAVYTTTYPTATPLPDSTAPVIKFTPLSSSPTKGAPTIQGTATDNQSIASIAYTIDDGKTWITVKTVTGLNTTIAQFSFQPVLPKDGNWTLKVRAKDGAGNTKISDLVRFSTDTSGPSISLATSLEKPMVQSPLITGTASDSASVDRVEYSLDTKNWLPVDKTVAEGNTLLFEFSLPPLDDGNYQINVRAFDSLGNPSAGFSKTLVIDRLPPRMGAMMVSQGPLILEPDNEGIIHTVTNVFHTVTLSAVGGPIEVWLALLSQSPQASATPIDTQELTKYNLHYSSGTGLWSTQMAIDQPGEYRIYVTARDGAGNTTEKQFAVIGAEPQGLVVGPDGTSIDATVTVYARDTTTQQYVVWSGAPYSQKNPLNLTRGQGFSYSLPSGTYYLEVIPKNKRYKSAMSHIFTLTHPTPIAPMVKIEKERSIHLLFLDIPIPSFTRSQITVTPGDTNSQVQPVQRPLLGTEFPNIPVSTGSDTISLDTLRGKKTQITLLNTWDPQAAAQMALLESAQRTNPGVQYVVVVPQESTASVFLYKRRGGYTLPIVADPNGELSGSLQYTVSPTQYTVDFSAKIEQYGTGLSTYAPAH